jgi:beta-xylosidase
VFRSTRPDGDYVDELGNTPYYDTYSFNYNTGIGVRLFGGYKWKTMSIGQVAQGHNSAFVDDDCKAYIVFHTRTTNGSEGHYVKINQLFVNKEGWLVAAPYATDGETLKEDGYEISEVAGDYEVIVHDLDVDYKNLDYNAPKTITLNEDGSITGAFEGTWSLEDGTPYIELSFNGDTYNGVTLSMNIEGSSVETMTFTALGKDSQITVWGSRMVD